MLHIVGTTDDPVPPVPPAVDAEVTFDDAWLLYPRHVAKKDALRAFDQVAKSQRVEMMIAIVAWRRVWLDRGELEYVPHFSTWVRGERWTDELPPGYTLMPRVSKAAPAVVQPEGERVPMPEHVRAELAKLKLNLKGGGK